MPARATTQPAVTLSDEDRWAQVELLLHDDTIRLYSRVAGLFLLLFAQPLSRTCRMRAEPVHRPTRRRLTVTFDTFPIELPEPLDRLVREHLTRRGQASYASRPDHWLFPGGIPGKHLATENIRSQLVERGIQPLAARNAAMFQLAAEIPTPILADILGLAPNTATRWAALAARDWSQYTAQRDTHLRRADPYEADASESAATSCSTVGDPATPSGVRVQPARQRHRSCWFSERIHTIDQHRGRAQEPVRLGLLRRVHHHALHLDRLPVNLERLAQTCLGQLPVRAPVEVEELHLHPFILPQPRVAEAGGRARDTRTEGL